MLKYVWFIQNIFSSSKNLFETLKNIQYWMKRCVFVLREGLFIKTYYLPDLTTSRVGSMNNIPLLFFLIKLFPSLSCFWQGGLISLLILLESKSYVFVFLFVWTITLKIWSLHLTYQTFYCFQAFKQAWISKYFKTYIYIYVRI